MIISSLSMGLALIRRGTLRPSAAATLTKVRARALNVSVKNVHLSEG